jgi:glyoxylase-like metal-dependent hydrolase (beta-lactamase superfamily II)
MIGPIPDSWVVDPALARAKPVAPGLWRLRLPSPYWHIDHSNAYLIEGVGGPTLVDCGSAGHPSGHAALERALADTGHSVGDVAELVITHHHSDHVGPAAWVRERSGCRVWMHPAVGHFADAVADPDGIEAKRRRRAEQEGVPAELLDVFASVAEEREAIDGLVEEAVPLTDGTVVPSGLGDWHVLETPGHAPSHVSLHQPALRTAISGDLVFAAFAPYYDYGCTPDPVAEFLGSLARLAALDLESAMPGHGRPMTRAELERAIAGHEAGVRERLERVRAALGDGERTGYEVLAELFPEEAHVPRGAWRLGEALAYLRHLRLQGAVARRTDADGVHRHALTINR